MSYIDPRAKLFGHLDRLHAIRQGETPPPVNVEIDLSNRCSHGCVWCLTREAMLDILGRGRCSIADVRPGDRVLAYNEATKRLEWAEVYAVSERAVHEPIYTIQVDGDEIEATGEHPVFTQRGWVEAQHLSTTDRIGYVSETVRMWLWTTGQKQGVTLSAGTQQLLAGDTPGKQRAHEAQQSDERPGSIRASRGYMARQRGEPDRVRENEATARVGRATRAGEYTDAARAELAAHEAAEPDARSGCGCQGQGDAATNGCGCESAGAAARAVARPGLSGGAGQAYEDAQPYVQFRHCGEITSQAVGAGCAIQDGTLVLGGLQEEGAAHLVFGNGRVLGQRQEPGLQGTWAQAGNRNHGRLHLPQAGAYGGELRGTDDQTLPESWLQLLGSDDAGTPLQVENPVANLTYDGCFDVPGYWSKRGLEFRRVRRVSPRVESTTVYNLETSLSTYIANGLAVHNCHFAHTHTRGPLANKTPKPEGHIDGGDLMEYDLACDVLSQLKQAGARSVTWTGGGEPTLHPRFDDVIGYADALGIEQGIYTHGGHISQERAHLLKRVMTWVYVSLDECDAESFRQSKGVDRYNAVIDGLHRLVGAQGKATLGVGFLLHSGNFNRVHDMVTLGKSLGVDYVQFRPTVQFRMASPGRVAEDTSWVTHAVRYLRTYEGDRFVIADIDRFRMYRDWQGHGYPTCYWSALQTVITPNGKVWRCTNKREHPDALLGDLSVEPFADIWARSGGPCAVDRACRLLCRGHLANQTMTELMQPVAHGSFI